MRLGQNELRAATLEASEQPESLLQPGSPRTSRIPVHDYARGDEAAHFDPINATALPVHFVWGGADEVFPPSWGRRWHRLIPHSTLDEIPDASHFLHDTHGKQLPRIVLEQAGPAGAGHASLER
jgi:pimeloyl-ACP methyl ester carboxylesterase